MIYPAEHIQTENAITRRLDSLQKKWESFLSLPASTCYWFCQQDELTMIDAFFQINADESSETNEILFKLESPFVQAEDYGKALSDELTALVDADREELAEEDIFIQWRSNYKKDSKNLALGFLRDFFQFALSLELEESKIIVFPLPLWNKEYSRMATLVD
jgi:hypothetical protein